MDELPGSLGTSASLALRFGQTIFSTASLLFMCLDVEFYSYTAFCYLVTVMGLVVPWSMTLVIVDVYSVFVRCLHHQPRIIMIIILGDLALSYLSLAAACTTASTTNLLLYLGGSYCPAKLCTRYQLSATMAFLSWFLSLDVNLAGCPPHHKRSKVHRRLGSSMSGSPGSTNARPNHTQKKSLILAQKER